MNKLLSFLLLISIHLFSQKSNYWVFFKDKNSTTAQISEECKNNRRLLGLAVDQYTDFAVNSNYISSVENLKVLVRTKSRWLNAVSVQANLEEIKSVEQLPFVAGIQEFADVAEVLSTDENYCKRRRKKRKDTLAKFEVSEALKMIQYEAFEKAKLNGENIKIGITDAGFLNLDTQDYFKKTIEQNRVVACKDFLSPRQGNQLFENITGKDSHGREVAKCVGGLSSKEQFGLAHEALYYLARSENAKEERRYEEDAWVAAMEWFDSLGVRLVNSSLGYGKGFDVASESYNYLQMNGYSTVVAKAAQIASTEKEMFIVNSAGNNGHDKEWHSYISSPADVVSILSIGATDGLGAKMGYSSIGPEYNGYIKPDVSAFSKNGTSFSAPLITGYVACIMQSNPSFCNDEIMNILYKSSSLYPYKNNYVGYGVPNCYKTIQLLKQEAVSDSVVSFVATDSIVKFTNTDFLSLIPESAAKIVVYHTQNPGFVVLMETLDVQNSSNFILKQNHEDYTLVLIKNKKIKIVWPTSTAILQNNNE